jgi:hypothetical protein
VSLQTSWGLTHAVHTHVYHNIVVCTENGLLASVCKGEEKKKSCLVFSPLRLKSFRAKLRCLRLARRSYEQPNRASGHMVVMALLESVCAATERPWHALCADPISGLGYENSKSVEGSKSMYVQCTFFSCIQTPKRPNSMQTTIKHFPNTKVS